MQDQKRLILESEWDILIVLDACRYDFFKDNFPDYFQGELKKARSPAFEDKGTATSVWLKNTFKERYDDMIYISSTPRANSKVKVEDFKAWEHFYKVIDVWESNWNEDFGTVFPNEVNKVAIEKINKFSNKKFIIHYMQPHVPYISLPPPNIKKSKEPSSRDNFRRKIRNLLGGKIRKIFKDKTIFKLMEFFRMQPLTPMGEALRKFGDEGIRKAYEENLRKALESIEVLIKNIDHNKKIFITSDHGELLGEKGKYEHEFESPISEKLIEVPWFKVRQ